MNAFRQFQIVLNGREVNKVVADCEGDAWEYVYELVEECLRGDEACLDYEECFEKMVEQYEVVETQTVPYITINGIEYEINTLSYFELWDGANCYPLEDITIEAAVNEFEIWADYYTATGWKHDVELLDSDGNIVLSM